MARRKGTLLSRLRELKEVARVREEKLASLERQATSAIVRSQRLINETRRYLRESREKDESSS